MTVRSEIAVVKGLLAEGELENLVKRWARCREVQIGDDGNIRIAYPQRSHWLSTDGLDVFVRWFKQQDLTESQVYHEPEPVEAKVAEAIAA